MRLILDHSILTSAEGLSRDEALAACVAEKTCAPTLHLYRYRPCVIVGRYQNLPDAVNMDACRRRGMEWNRRHSGGGAVMMGPDQVAVALALPDERGRFIGSVREHFRFFASVMAGALAEFGVPAALAGKNDLQADGRKIAGLAISQDIDGAVFFHASLLIEFDVEAMVDILNLATRHLDDRGQSCFARRLATVREFAPRADFEGLSQAIARSLAARMGCAIEPGAWEPPELALHDRLRRERYENESWIYSSRVMRRWTGSAERKTPGGWLRVYADCAGGRIDSILVTGDYFSRCAEIARLESGLRGAPIRVESIAEIIQREVPENGSEPIYRVAAGDLAELILAAATSSAAAAKSSADSEKNRQD